MAGHFQAGQIFIYFPFFLLFFRGSFPLSPFFSAAEVAAKRLRRRLTRPAAAAAVFSLVFLATPSLAAESVLLATRAVERAGGDSRSRRDCGKN